MLDAMYGISLQLHIFLSFKVFNPYIVIIAIKWLMIVSMYEQTTN